VHNEIREGVSLHKLVRITENARYGFEISREVGYPHGDRHRDCSQAGSEPKNQEQAPKTFNGTGQIRIQSWKRDTKAHKKVGART
jgi:hypothetical protein